MKANELRIGNLVQVIDVEGSYKPVKVTEIKKSDNKGYTGVSYKDGLINCWSALQIVSPIPLTEEWLVKFGFENFMKRILKTDLYLQTMEDERGVEVYLSTDIGYGLVTDPKATIDGIFYVHQLQNLYFALTGEELTMNE